MRAEPLFRSARHELLANEFPPEPASWLAPSPVRAAFGGCSCSLGAEVCTCAPETQPAVFEPDPPRLDGDGKRLVWFAVAVVLGVPALVVLIGLAAALL